MRFLIVLCLVGAACAQYNYEASSSNGLTSYDAPASSASYSAPSYSAPAGVDKQFYTFEADENDFNDGAASEQIANSLKKNLRVVFIKGPENRGLENAALALARQAAEQQTAIYVLNRQADIGDLANKFNEARNNQNSRPEVHFVKYRTPEDAANAQRTIQSQYDQLGGTSQNIHGGVAPAINFASAARTPIAQHSSYAAPSAPSSSYLPANILRRLRLRI